MVKNRDFHSVEFFRKVRDEHAAILAGKRQEEIIAFFGGPEAPDRGLSRRSQPLPYRADRTGRPETDDGPR